MAPSENTAVAERADEPSIGAKVAAGRSGARCVLDRSIDWCWSHRILVSSVLITCVAVVVSYRSRPAVLLDDAAITARYAERLATGHGWTYNDGDRTNGASAPLHAMAVAALHFLGIGTIVALRLIASVAFAVVAGLVAYIAGRIGGVAAALFAGVLAMSSILLRDTGLGGMESLPAAALGLVVIVALLDGRETMAGVFLGLAIVNKLDAGFLALALVLAYLLVQRRVPWRIAGTSALVAAPWVGFATIYFGSPLPYSMTQKMAGDVDNPTWEHHIGWIWEVFGHHRAKPLVYLAAAAVLLVPWLARRSRWSATALTVALIWPLAHGLVFSLVELGDAYLWYMVVLYPPMIVAAAVVVTTLPRLVVARWSRPRRSDRRRMPVGGAVSLLAAVLVLFLVFQPEYWVKSTANVVRYGHEVQEYEAFEIQRRAAGRYVGDVAEPGDVVQTCWGWIAYGAIDQPIDETCALNTREPVGPAKWAVVGMFPGSDPPVVPPGAVLSASFFSSFEDGGRVDVIELDAAESSVGD